MRTFVVTYIDERVDLVEADFAELVGDCWHLVRPVGHSGEERRREIEASVVLDVAPR